MDKLKQFDKSFGVSFSLTEVQAIFVNNIEATIFTKLRKQELGITYYEFIDKFCLLSGIKLSDFKIPGSSQLMQLRLLSNSDFIQTMRFVVIAYDIIKDTRSIAYFDAMVHGIIADLPGPLGVRWIDGNFYKDDFPEITKELFADNLGWLSEFPAAKADLQIALKHYSAGDKDGIIENVYKAVEQVAQQITGKAKALHDHELAVELFSLLNVSAAWRGFLKKFIAYANDYARHGRNEDRHAADVDEIESFLFLALIMLRMISKKDKRYATMPIDRQSLFEYITKSRLVKRVEKDIISINPKLKILTDHTEFNAVTKGLLRNMEELGLKSIGEVEALLLKYERKLILDQQIELKDEDVDYVGQGMCINALINYVVMNDLEPTKKQRPASS